MTIVIVTVTLNPAIDRTVSLKTLSVDKVNRVLHVQRDAGGKGLNVSKTIKALGGESVALVVLGGRNGMWIEEEANRMGLNLEVVPVLGETRENIKLVDLTAKQYTDLNEPGPQNTEALTKAIQDKLTDIVSEGDYVVLAGSALPGMAADIFASLSQGLNDKGVKVILDIEGEYLQHALVTKPYLIKPNIDELESFLGKRLKTTEDIVLAARDLIGQGVGHVAVSRGSEGLLWIDADQVISADALKVEVKSTVGAGDAVVAALVKGLNEQLAPELLVKTAVATATSVVMNSGSQTGNMENIQELMNQIQIHRL